MNKADILNVSGIDKIDGTFGGVIKVLRVNGNNAKKYKWADYVKKFLRTPEDSFPIDFSIVFEVTGDKREFCLFKTEEYGDGSDNDSYWTYADGVRDEKFEDGLDVVYWGDYNTFDSAYFHFMASVYKDKLYEIRSNPSKKNDEQLFELKLIHTYNNCVAELNKIWKEIKPT